MRICDVIAQELVKLAIFHYVEATHASSLVRYCELFHLTRLYDDIVTRYAQHPHYIVHNGLISIQSVSCSALLSG